MPVDAPKRLFSVDEYYEMAQQGILRPDNRVELIEGEIVQMTPIGSSHAGGVNWLSFTLMNKLGTRAVVSTQNPIRLSDYSEPQPDLLILKPREDFYRKQHPRVNEVYWIIEVADSLKGYDRKVKIELYAEHGIPEFWIVDLVKKVVEVYKHPEGIRFRDMKEYYSGDTISPLSFPNLVLPVKDILS